MATPSAYQSVHPTLSNGVADTVTLGATGAIGFKTWQEIEVTNHDSTLPLYFRTDGQAAVVKGNDTTRVEPKQSVRFAPYSTNPISVSVIAAGAIDYSVQGLGAGA